MMHGTPFEKIRRTVLSLLSTPQYSAGYFTTNFLRKTPLDVELPWFSYAAIDFLEGFLSRDMKVFEYGSGGSTIFFAKRSHSVIATEDSSEWLKKAQVRLEQSGLHNVTFQHRQFDVKNPIGFATSSYLHSIPPQRFDVIVVDGTEEYIGQTGKPLVRAMCFYYAEAFIRPGGIIIVDDSWCYPQLRLTNRAKALRVFQSVGPCRVGATSTDVFFY